MAKKPIQEAEIIEPVETQKASTATKEQVVEKPKRWNIGNIFWGLLLVLVGTLFLLANLDLITVNFANVWQLWPVFIIGAGLSLLSIRGWLGGLISVLASIALLGLVVFTVVENPWYSGLRGNASQTNEVSEGIGSASRLNATIDTGAATIEFGSNANQAGIAVTQRSNGLELRKEASTDGDTRTVLVETKSPNGFFWLGRSMNEMKVDLTQKTPVSLKVDAGATTVRGDLSQVRLTSLAIDAGASSIDVRLGAKEARQEVNIDAGASSVVLYVPKQLGVRIESDGGLTATNFEGVEKTAKNTYESKEFSAAERQIVIRADIGASRFDVRRY